MTLFNTIFVALSPVVARVREDTFEQTGGVYPVPAVRVSLVSGEVFPDLCGNDMDTGNPRYQIDVIHDSAKARGLLVPLIAAAMDSLSPPAILDGMPRNSYDPETKRYLASFDYVLQPSSAP